MHAGSGARMAWVTACLGSQAPMADAKGKAREILGWLTGDRKVEAEGRAERHGHDHPTDEEVAESTAYVREEYGETPDGSGSPDGKH